MITLKELKDLLFYNELDGSFIWNKDKGRAKKGMLAGCKYNTGYIIITINKVSYPRARLVWFYKTRAFT